MQNIDVDPKSIYIHHHLGLGDHIICNGLVRYLLKATDAADVWLVVKNKNLNNVKRMYSDDSRINFIPVEEDSNFYDMPFNWHRMRLLRVGFEKTRESDFDVSFYDSIGVPFCERWNSWYCHRDKNREKLMMDELCLPDRFCLVHDVSSIGKFNLNIQTKLPVISVSKLKSEISIFDWSGIIQLANEIHCIDSSFIHLVNSLDNITDRLFYHKIKPSKMNISFAKQWSIVQYTNK